MKKIKKLEEAKVKLEKGLTRKEALIQANKKRPRGDFRGFTYDAKTGIGIFT